MTSMPTDASPPSPELTAQYKEAIARLGAAFKADPREHPTIMAQARQAMAAMPPQKIADTFGLGSGYSLAKEFACDILAANAGAVARLLALADHADQARDFLQELYRQAIEAGFDRSREFLLNRIDSRTFMPMRNRIDVGYLHAIGYDQLGRTLLCVGDRQTMIQAEMLRNALPLKGVDIMAYQHLLGSLTSSPLADCFTPIGYFFFVNACADYLIQHRGTPDGRDKQLDRARSIVAWLKTRPVRRSVFVTHVYCGIDRAIRNSGCSEESALDAVGAFSDEFAAILSEAPGARLINFQEVCPFTRDSSVFRDGPDANNLLHFRFDIMGIIAERIADAFSDL